MKKLMFLLFLLAAVMACNSTAVTDTPVVPTATATSGPCAYVPAYQDLPDVSAQVDQVMKMVQPDAAGRAQAYGENCIYSDGHADFTAMETDFYVTVNVTDINDDNELGTWIINAMKALASFTPGVVPGPQPGFVEFTFDAKDAQKGLLVPISKYQQLPSNLSAAEIFQAFSPKQ